MDYIIENLKWIAPAVIATIGGLYKLYTNSKVEKKADVQTSPPNTGVNISQNTSEKSNSNANVYYHSTVNQGVSTAATPKSAILEEEEVNFDKLKLTVKILFIDDDKDFNVVKILIRAGWKNTTTVIDLDNLDSPLVKGTDIFFVDINGIGKKIGFKDEGLGLASALKSRYPKKKVVIYSSNDQKLHKVFNQADAVLEKNAEPFEFLTLVEELSKSFHGK